MMDAPRSRFHAARARLRGIVRADALVVVRPAPSATIPSACFPCRGGPHGRPNHRRRLRGPNGSSVMPPVRSQRQRRRLPWSAPAPRGFNSLVNRCIVRSPVLDELSVRRSHRRQLFSGRSQADGRRLVRVATGGSHPAGKIIIAGLADSLQGRDDLQPRLGLAPLLANRVDVREQ